MKIDDASKETMLRLMTAGTMPGGDTSDTESAGLKVSIMASQESFELLVGDSLLNFADKMNRGQNMLRSLPADVRAYVLSTGVMSENMPASLEQGLSAPVQAQRKFVDTIKMLAHDFEILKNIPQPERSINLPSNLGQRIESLFQQVKIPSIQLSPQAQQPVNFNQIESVLLKFATASPSTPSLPAVFSAWMAGNPLLLASTDQTVAAAYRLLEPLVAQAAPAVREMAQRIQRNDPVLLEVVLKAVATGQIESLQPEVKEKIMQWLDQGSNVLSDLPESVLAGNPEMINLAAKLEIIVKQLASQPIIKQELEKLLASLVESEVTPEGGEFGRSEIPAKLIPPEVREAATKLAQPSLVRLWQDLKVNDLQQWSLKDTPQLEKASQALREIASLFDVPKDSSTQNRSNSGATSYSWQLVFYPAGPDKPYPALIQVYRDGGDSEPGSGAKREDLWIRVALKTENIGVVDLSFHLQGRRFLSVMTRFADPETAAMFREWRSEMIKSLSSDVFDLRAFQIYSRLSETEG
jgi:hypothetical protein